jgi:hypothetical protein
MCGSSQPRCGSVLAEDPVATLPEQFTLCSSTFLANKGSTLNAWADVLKEDLTHWFFIYQNIKNEKKDTEEIVHSLWINVNGAYSYLSDFGPLRYNRWFHLCIGLDLASGLVSPVVDGIVIDEKVVEGLGMGRPASLAGRLVLGRSWYDSTWNQDTQMVSGIQVFGHKLTSEKMAAITGGAECGAEGDYLSWREMRWEVRGPGTVWRNVTMTELCTRDTAVRFISTAKTTNALGHR